MTFPLPLIHLWRNGKWGSDRGLDCRECRICGRFEVWAYTSFHKADRTLFEPVFMRARDRATE